MVKKDNVSSDTVYSLKNEDKLYQFDKEIPLKFSRKSIEFMETLDFGSRLAKSLNEQDRSASWLARQIGVHPSTVSKWLSGETQPLNGIILGRIIEVLELDKEYYSKRAIEISKSDSFFEKLVDLENSDSLNNAGVTINLAGVPVEIDTDLGKIKGILYGKLKLDTKIVNELQKNDI